MQTQPEDILIEQLKDMAQRDGVSPVTEEELLQAEAQLGFALPSFVRRLYGEVANGGFGGMFPLNGRRRSAWSAAPLDTVVTAYLAMRSLSREDVEKHWSDEDEKPALWPQHTLMICDWGCNIYSCLDCASPDLPVLRMDSNRNFLVEWAIEAPSLRQWLEAWMDGQPLFDMDWESARKVPVSQLG